MVGAPPPGVNESLRSGMHENGAHEDPPARDRARGREFPNLLWVRLHTDQGPIGLGETSVAATSVEAYLHEYVAPRVLGRNPLGIEALTRSLQGYLGYRGSGVETRAVSAVAMALWDLFGKACGKPLYQMLGGASRPAIRTYNTCAGYRYIRDARQQTSANWGLGGGSEGPYEDLDAFLHRADELAHSLLEQGITAMKIWPFDTCAEASDGMHIFRPGAGGGAGAVPAHPQGGWQPHGHHGRIPFALAAAAGAAHRARWRSSTPTGTRTRSAWTRWRC